MDDGWKDQVYAFSRVRAGRLEGFFFGEEETASWPYISSIWTVKEF